MAAAALGPIVVRGATALIGGGGGSAAAGAGATRTTMVMPKGPPPLPTSGSATIPTPKGPPVSPGPGGGGPGGGAGGGGPPKGPPPVPTPSPTPGGGPPQRKPIDLSDFDGSGLKKGGGPDIDFDALKKPTDGSEKGFGWEELKHVGKLAMKGLDMLAAGAEKAGATTAAIARNDFRGVLDQVPLVPTALKRMVGAFDDATDAMIARGRELKGLNAELAEANARADVRKFLADFREANRVGPNIARLTESKSRLETQLQDAFAPLKASLAGILAKMTEAIERSRVFDILAIILEQIANGVDNISDLADGRVDRIVERLRKLPQELADAMNPLKDKKNDLDEFLNNLWNDSLALNNANPMREKPKIAEGRFGLGIFDGMK